MSQPNWQEWYHVSVTLKNITDASDTLSVVFANRAYIDGTGASTEPYLAWPILKSITGIGATVEGGMTYPAGGAITLDNSPHSIGYERRIGDIFERYTAINQTVTITHQRTVPSSLDPSSSSLVDNTLNTVWTATISGVVYDFGGDTITLSINADRIPARIATYEITDDIATVSDAIGKHLPIVFGEDVQLRPVLIADDSTPTWAYATCMHIQYKTGGVQKYYTRDDAGEWQQVASPAATTTLLYGVTGSSSGSPDGWASDYEFAVKLDYAPGTSSQYIIYGGYISCTGDVAYSAVDNSTIVFKILEGNDNATPAPEKDKILRQRAVLKSDYATALATASAFSLYFTFDDPLLVSSDRTLYLSIYNADGTNALKMNITGTASTVWYTPPDEPSFVYQTSSSDSYIYGFYGLKFTDTAYSAGNSLGLGYASFEISQNTTPATYTNAYVNPDVSNLDFIVEIDGILDDSRGTITGSASSIITAPHYIAELLTLTWNGTVWSTSVAAANDTHKALTTTTHPFYRKVTGRTDGRISVKELLQSIAWETCCTIVHNGQSAGTYLKVYAYGTTETVQATFSDDDIVISSLEIQGRESVINRCQIAYKRLLTNADFVEYISQGGDRNYSGFLDMYYNDGGAGEAISADSYALYGERVLAENRLNWIGDETSAKGVAKCILTDCEQPKAYARFSVPYWKASELTLMDLIALHSAQLPSFYGTTTDAELPTYGGYEVDILAGRDFRRFKRYKGRIVGLQYYFSEGGATRAEITAQLLTNQFDPSL